MKIFIIGAVRKVSDDQSKKLTEYVASLEREGHTVHLPQRDTDQKAAGVDICTQNKDAIASSDEVHVFYDPDSTGSHFDLGMAFALNKKIKVILNQPYGEGKSFPRMLVEWERSK